MNSELSNLVNIFFSPDINMCKEIITNKDKLSQESKKIFDAVDTNKDGLIDFNEFAVLIKEIEKKSCKTPEEMEKFEKNYLTPEKIEKTFKAFDTNHDNMIDTSEFQEIFKEMMEANLIAHGIK